MKLYVYDHCPYCVKARLIFGLKNIPFEMVTLLNDDEETPVQMIGQKMVPILVEDGKSPLPESLDIIQYIDNIKNPIVNPSPENLELNNWLKNCKEYLYQLAMPRWVKMGLEEFATPAAVDYFTKRKENYIGPFGEHLEKTQAYITMAHSHLAELDSLYQGDDFFWSNCTYDDFHLFAALRCLTTVKGLSFPSRIDNYMKGMSEKSKVPLHWDQAL